MSKLIRRRHITSLKAFLPNYQIHKIIDLAKLNYVEDWHQWTDGTGLSFCVDEKRRIKIKKCSLQTKEIDIYSNARPEDLIKLCSWAYMFYYNEKYWLFCIAHNKLRLFVNTENQWCRAHSVFDVGVKNLLTLSENINNSLNYQSCWAGAWPPELEKIKNPEFVDKFIPLLEE